MPADVRFILDERAYEDLFRSPDGPVGQLIAELDERAAMTARGIVHVYPGTARSTIWNPATSTALLPAGYTKGTIRVHGPVRGSRGGLYGGVNAAAAPTIFLEHPAEQMRARGYPFLTTALNTLRV